MATDLRLREQLTRTNQADCANLQRGKLNQSPTGHCPLPNYDVVISCCEDLKEILYPGYRRREGLHIGNVMYHVGDLIDRLHDRLTCRSAVPAP